MLLEHGCRKGGDAVNITEWACSITVANPAGATFDVDSILRRQRMNLARSEMRVPGRGLVLVDELSDDLRSVQDGLAVKAVLERSPVSLEITTEENILVIYVRSGANNDSLERRVFQVAYEHLSFHIVLDLSGAESGIGTSPISVIIRLAALCRKSGHKVVAIVPYNCGTHVPGALRASSRREAVERLRALPSIGG